MVMEELLKLAFVLLVEEEGGTEHSTQQYEHSAPSQTRTTTGLFDFRGFRSLSFNLKQRNKTEYYKVLWCRS